MLQPQGYFLILILMLILILNNDSLFTPMPD